jgi:protein-S-isoprenylcysteine O-methyltransferase Ste14
MPASKRPTPRKLFVYACTAALVFLADPTPAGVVAGGLLVAAGIALRIWACGHLEKNRLVVTTGPYAHVKNPLYLGSFLISLGLLSAAASASPRGRWVLFGFAPLLLVAFFAVYMPRKKRTEGGRLEAKFGEEWKRYDAAVRDFLPRLRPWRSGDARVFSWRRVFQNHEPPMDLLVASLFLLVALRPHLPALG